MASKNAKQFLYRYNGVEAPEEVVDGDGEIAVPKQGEIINRKGKKWKVVQVITQQTVAGNRAIPVVRIFLTDKLR